MRPGRVLLTAFTAFAALAPSAFVACGSDDEGPRRAGAGSGGSAGTSGGGAGGAGADASAGSAGSGGSSGSGASDAGTDAAQCTPRDQVKDPIYSSITVESSCTAPTPCGGALTDGNWLLTDACIERGNLFPQVLGRCSAATVSSSVDPGAGGSLAIAGGAMTLSFKATLTASISFPNACHGCRCTDLENDLRLAGLTGVSCSPQCAGGTCFCTAGRTIDVSVAEPFTTQGTEIVTSSNRTFDYCVAGGELSLRESAGAPYLTFRPTADLITPEICDGVDNDRDGVTDDDPVECPDPCNTQGVCAQVEVSCSGRSGWTCKYTSPAREPGEETKCDKLDNDCDGFVDEGIDGCTEICNGLDDDANGSVDDNPSDPPPCPTLTGECTQGVTATCAGSAGWRCAYTSANFEAGESKCDGLDNDCDGLKDEGCGCPTGASKVYVLAYAGNSTSTANGIYRANLDGTGVETVLGLTGSTVLGFQVNPADQKVYYYDFVTEQIRRIPLAGGTSELVWTGRTQQWTIHPAANRVYHECGITNICAFDLATPGTVQTIVQPAQVSALSVDTFTRKLYWADHTTTMARTVNRAELDGTLREEVFDTGTFAPEMLVLDPHRNRLYTGGLSGVTAASFVTRAWSPVYTSGGADVRGVALDPRAGKLYWAENATGIVRRANVDGSSVEPIISTVAEPWSVDLYLCAP